MRLSAVDARPQRPLSKRGGAARSTTAAAPGPGVHLGRDRQSRLTWSPVAPPGAPEGDRLAVQTRWRHAADHRLQRHDASNPGAVVKLTPKPLEATNDLGCPHRLGREALLHDCGGRDDRWSDDRKRQRRRPPATRWWTHFRPAPPKDLKSISGRGAINLIWEPQRREGSRAATSCSRGVEPAQTLEPVTAAPIVGAVVQGQRSAGHRARLRRSRASTGPATQASYRARVVDNRPLIECLADGTHLSSRAGRPRPSMPSQRENELRRASGDPFRWTDGGEPSLRGGLSGVTVLGAACGRRKSCASASTIRIMRAKSVRRCRPSRSCSSSRRIRRDRTR